MKVKAVILLLLVSTMHSCNKDKIIPATGTVTLNNKLVFDKSRQTYIGYGFLFSKAGQVSILDKPAPDIFVYSDGANLSFQANNLQNSFYNAGEYSDAVKASEEFTKLTAPSVPQWTGMASPLKENQIWIYKSGDEHFAKMRIISILMEVSDERDYGECTFEWRYQPDGSLTFPAR